MKPHLLLAPTGSDVAPAAFQDDNRQRYSESPTAWSSRLAGLSGTVCIAALTVFALLFTWQIVRPPVSPSPAPLMVEFQPLASPPDPVRELPPGPVQMERTDSKPPPDQDVPPPPIVLREPSSSAPATPKPLETVDPGPPVPQTTAPKSIAAPAAERLSSETLPNWEASVLAHLERFRRYPPRARAARQQGVAYIRFTMDRTGAVLARTLVRKSGFFSLDQAALDTIARAQPLPAIPADRPGIVELTVPIMFELS